MKAQQKDLYAEKREKLYKVLPLDTPFSINIEPITFCNLRCRYCIHSLTEEERAKAGYVAGMLGRPIFDAFVEQLKQFPKPFRVISFIGDGEPLLHKDLPYMIEQLSRYRLADNIQVLTNGTLLTHQLSLDLINAGVKTIKISVNGFSAGEYLENCGIAIDFERYIEELRFLYQSKRDALIFIKTVTPVLKDRSKDVFFSAFGSFCDRIAVENVIPLFSGVSYDVKANPTSRFSSVRETVKVCASPFIRMSINYDGTVRICGSHNGFVVDNDVKNFFKVWNGTKHREIMLKTLREERNGITESCNQCPGRNDFAFEEDNLDPYADELYAKIASKP